MTTQNGNNGRTAWSLPAIIQGGMGVAVSNWRLARAVASRGMLGVVSGTGIDSVLARRLQHGDPDGELREAIAAFPAPAVAERAIERYYIEGGKAPDKPYRLPGMFRLDSPNELLQFSALSAFVEVWLARKGHNGPVGINLLEKIAMPNPALLYGAMLAGVSYVLMGAGIPWQIPGVLDHLARHEPAALRIGIDGDMTGEVAIMEFDPACVMGDAKPPIQRPNFLAIVTAPVIAQSLLKKASGSIEGFIVEGYTAGGHNAPPRGPLKVNEKGEPIYGERDEVDLAKFRELGKPFWLAGGYGVPGGVAIAQAEGAAGIQVGTLFAFCGDSGIEPELRRSALEQVAAGKAGIFTDPLASPTGFPFKVVAMEGTLSEGDAYEDRTRVCDVGYLRKVARLPDGSVGYRCASEPVKDFERKGGDLAEVEARKCLCNALLANVGLGQVRRDGRTEGVLLTAGDDLAGLPALLGDRLFSYRAGDVIDILLGPPQGA